MTTKALTVIQQQTALARPTIQFSPEQRTMIRNSFANGASDSEFAVLMAVAEARGLNPLLRQIHFVKRWDSNRRTEVWAYQTSIDGLRAVAQRTGNYDGQDDATFEYESDGKTLKLARVNVYRKGIGRPFTGTARFREYAQVKKDGALTSFWTSKGHIMLAKCAEALALRKAFPEDTSGLYIDAEIPRAERVAASGAAIEGQVVREEAPSIAGQLVARLEQGFPSIEAKRAWAEENRQTKGTLSTEELARVSEAFRSAPVGKTEAPKSQAAPPPPTPGEDEPPDNLPDEPPLFNDEPEQPTP